MRPSRGGRVRGLSRRLGPVASARGCRACWRRHCRTRERQDCFGRKDGNTSCTALEATRHQVASETGWCGVNATRAGARSFGSEEPHGTCQDLGRAATTDIVSHGDGVGCSETHGRDQLGRVRSMGTDRHLGVSMGPRHEHNLKPDESQDWQRDATSSHHPGGESRRSREKRHGRNTSRVWQDLDRSASRAARGSGHLECMSMEGWSLRTP